MKHILNMFSRFRGLSQHLWVSPLCFFNFYYCVTMHANLQNLKFIMLSNIDKCSNNYYYHQLTSTRILSYDIHAGRSATNTGAIVGGAVGSSIILLLVILLLLILIVVLMKVFVIRRGRYSKQ